MHGYLDSVKVEVGQYTTAVEIRSLSYYDVLS